jgi:hypothetical protein
MTHTWLLAVSNICVVTKSVDFTKLGISVNGIPLKQIGSQFQEKTTKFLSS